MIVLLWVLWYYHEKPWSFGNLRFTMGWEGVAGMEREECLETLKDLPRYIPATCVPAGILLRPLAVFRGHMQPERWREWTEFDLSPEAR